MVIMASKPKQEHPKLKQKSVKELKEEIVTLEMLLDLEQKRNRSLARKIVMLESL